MLDARHVSRKLPRQVWLLGLVSLLNDISTESVYPLLPLFVVVALGASATDLGWIEGTAQAVVAAMAAYAGIRSDRGRRMPWVRTGYALPAVGKAILTVAASWPLVLVGRAVDRLGKGVRSSPKDALIADVTPDESRGRAYGLERAMDTAGAFIGTSGVALFGWWCAADASASVFRTVFAVAAAVGLGAVVLTLLVKEPPRPAAPKISQTPAPAARLPRAYWQTLAILMVFALANSSDTFILLRAADVGMAWWQGIAAYALYNLVYAAASYPAGALSDRIGRWPLVGIGWAIYALAYGGFALATPAAIWPVFAVYGVYTALTDGVGKALIADHAPRAYRGRALGIFNLCTAAATLASSVLAGVIWDRVGHAATFWLGAIAAAVALLVLVALRPRAATRAP